MTELSPAGEHAPESAPTADGGVDVLLADVRRQNAESASAATLREFASRAASIRDALSERAAALDRQWAGSLLDRSASEAAEYESVVRVIAHDRRRAELLTTELEARAASAAEWERDQEFDAKAAQVRARRRRWMEELAPKAEKHLKALGGILQELQALADTDRNLLADLEREGRKLDQVLGDDPSAYVGPPGALRCYHGQLIQELVPFLPSTTEPEPFWGAEWGERPEDAEAKRRSEMEREAEFRRQRRERELEVAGPRIITLPQAEPLRTASLGHSAGRCDTAGAAGEPGDEA